MQSEVLPLTRFEIPVIPSFKIPERVVRPEQGRRRWGRTNVDDSPVERRQDRCASCQLLLDPTANFPPLSSPVLSPLFHCPMQGPQAFARTVAPTSSNVPCSPSRSIVARINSLPGVTRNGTLLFSPAALACSAMEATRDMSSYDEFVQDPIKAEERTVG